MKDADYWIYRITSPTGKVYIGQTCNLIRRFQCYKYLNCKKQWKLYASLKKYGVNAHKFSILLSIYDEPIENVIKAEQKCIDVFRRHGFELMNLKDAEGSGKHSEETRRKMSAVSMGKPGTNNKSVIQYINGLPAKEFPSVKAAWLAINKTITQPTIRRICRGERPEYLGYVFKYKDPQ